jgi:hypothetical protein
MVSGNSLEPTYCYRLLLLGQATTAAGGLTGPIAGTAQHPGKHIGFPVDHVSFGIFPGSDQADVFGYRSMRRTGILAVDDPMIIFRILCICRLHNGIPVDFEAGRISAAG